MAAAAVAQASDSEGREFRCSTSAEVRSALKHAAPGDSILLEGGRVYEIEKSFKLRGKGTENNPIRFTSLDPSGQGRYAVITTVGQKKEPDLTAIQLTGSYWVVSRIEISGARVPLPGGFWDTNGFLLGLYLHGAASHHNIIEDVHIHHTHNAAVAVRDESHHNRFSRLNIHHIGEWLHEDYNAHEGEGFYLGSSKSFSEEGNKARIHDILIEDSVVGPGVLGQYVDIKYGASAVTVRNNVFRCDEKSYNEEVIKLAGFANLVEGNRFVGSSKNLKRYIHLFNKKTKDPVRVNYLGQKNIPAPTGRDNSIMNNIFYTDDPAIHVVDADVAAADRSSNRIEGNRIEPLENGNRL
jgi:hypothetical protein